MSQLSRLESEQGYKQLTLFQQDILAKVSALQEIDLETCLLQSNLSELHPNLDPDGLSERMLEAILETDLMKSLGCWQPKATKQGHLYYKLKPLERHTNEKESLLWGTPRNSDGMKNLIRNPENIKANGKGRLEDQVALRIRNVPTPTHQDRRNATPPPSQLNRDSVVGYVMRNWPTPATSQMHKPVRGLAPSEANSTHGTMLVAAIGERNPNLIGRYLNPNWCEWLMGFETGWTLLDV